MAMWKNPGEAAGQTVHEEDEIKSQRLEAAELELLAAQTHPRTRDTSPARRPEASDADLSRGELHPVGLHVDTPQR